MTRRSGAGLEQATTVVRLFPGWADSVVWFPGPVPYEETRLDADLLDDLREWERSYHASLTGDYAWPSAEVAAAHAATGARLARRLADQLGDEFEVEHDLGESHRRVRGPGPARNPAAAAVFRRLADDARAEHRRLQRAVDRAHRDGHTLEWRADPGPG